MTKSVPSVPYIAIIRYKGMSGGFATNTTTRYRAELVGYNDITIPLGNGGGSYGFSERSYAEQAAVKFADALNLQTVYFNEFEKIHTTRKQVRTEVPARRYWSGHELVLSSLSSVFVFGSNPEGRHGAGAARYAVLNYGAIYGKGRGLQGCSYALPTKNLTAGYTEPATGIKYLTAGVRSLTPQQIEANIAELYEHAASNPHYTYYIAYTMDGRNLNGYSGEEMRDMFMHTEPPENIVFHESFM